MAEHMPSKYKIRGSFPNTAKKKKRKKKKTNLDII